MSHVSPGIFREYDIRGIAGGDLNADAVELVGRAYGTTLRRAGHAACAVGRDNRPSGVELSAALIRGLRSTGCDVIEVGEVITPALYFSRVHFDLPGGVMVTGSHNPPAYNGLKLNWGNGSLYGDDIQNLLRLIQADDLERGDGAVREADIIPAYHEMLRTKTPLGPRRVKAVIDSGNGAAGPVVHPFIESLGVEVTALYCDSDPTYPNHHPDPTKLDNIRVMAERVRAEGADVGLGFDGDCDRLGAVDERGEVIWADQLMILYAREILKSRPGAPIILDVKCSQALADEVIKAGGRPVMWKTGHSLIKAKLWEDNAPFGGEMSGHLFFKDEYFGYDDALYAACRLVRMLSNSDQSLSQMLAAVPQFFSTPEIRVHCPEQIKFEVVKAAVVELKRKFDHVIDIDGARVVTDEGWGLVRASNTQPALIVRCEGKTREALERMKAIIGGALAKFPEVKLDWSHQGE